MKNKNILYTVKAMKKQIYNGWISTPNSEEKYIINSDICDELYNKYRIYIAEEKESITQEIIANNDLVAEYIPNILNETLRKYIIHKRTDSLSDDKIGLILAKDYGKLSSGYAVKNNYFMICIDII